MQFAKVSRKPTKVMGSGAPGSIYEGHEARRWVLSYYTGYPPEI